MWGWWGVPRGSLCSIRLTNQGIVIPISPEKVTCARNMIPFPVLFFLAFRFPLPLLSFPLLFVLSFPFPFPLSLSSFSTFFSFPFLFSSPLFLSFPFPFHLSWIAGSMEYTKRKRQLREDGPARDTSSQSTERNALTSLLRIVRPQHVYDMDKKEERRQLIDKLCALVVTSSRHQLFSSRVGHVASPDCEQSGE